MAIVEHAELAPLADIMAPRWWTGTPSIAAERYVIDAHGLDRSALVDPDGDLAEQMRRRYAEVGLVHVVNTGLADLADQRAVAKQKKPQHYCHSEKSSTSSCP